MSISSTHNTRIERLWVEVGRNFCRSWRAFFFRLECQFGLDCSDPSHIWLLQNLFLDDINTDCDTFSQQWNSHPISGSDTHDLSPQVHFLVHSLRLSSESWCRIYVFFDKQNWEFTTRMIVKGYTPMSSKNTTEQRVRESTAVQIKPVPAIHLKSMTADS